MYFKEILNLNKDECGLMDFNELTNLLPCTPKEVVKQFFYDHGRKCEFQEQYSNLNIKKLNWSIIEIKANDIVKCSCYEDYIEYVDEICNRLDKFEEEAFSCIDIRDEVVKNWEKKSTWLKKPIFLDASLINKSNKLHLVEGHTRLGILKGLLSKGLINQDTTHKVWFGKY